MRRIISLQAEYHFQLYLIRMKLAIRQHYPELRRVIPVERDANLQSHPNVCPLDDSVGWANGRECVLAQELCDKQRINF